MINKDSSEERCDNDENDVSFDDGLCDTGRIEGRKLDTTNIPVCTTGNYSSYDTPSTSNVIEASNTSKRYLDATYKESYTHGGISPNLVETIIKGESMFDEQLAKLCEGPSLPSLRIEGQMLSKAKEKTAEFGIGGGNKHLVKDEFLAAIRDDLSEEYPPLYRENTSRISEERRKYIAERVANATADAAAAAERHWRFNNTKTAM